MTGERGQEGAGEVDFYLEKAGGEGQRIKGSSSEMEKSGGGGRLFKDGEGLYMLVGRRDGTGRNFNRRVMMSEVSEEQMGSRGQVGSHHSQGRGGGILNNVMVAEIRNGEVDHIVESSAFQ